MISSRLFHLKWISLPSLETFAFFGTGIVYPGWLPEPPCVYHFQPDGSVMLPPVADAEGLELALALALVAGAELGAVEGALLGVVAVADGAAVAGAVVTVLPVGAVAAG